MMKEVHILKGTHQQQVRSSKLRRKNQEKMSLQSKYQKLQKKTNQRKVIKVKIRLKN